MGKTRLVALYKGLTTGFCGSLTTWSKWNQQLSLLLVGETQTDSQPQVIQASKHLNRNNLSLVNAHDTICLMVDEFCLPAIIMIVVFSLQEIFVHACSKKRYRNCNSQEL